MLAGWPRPLIYAGRADRAWQAGARFLVAGHGVMPVADAVERLPIDRDRFFGRQRVRRTGVLRGILDRHRDHLRRHRIVGATYRPRCSWPRAAIWSSGSPAIASIAAVLGSDASPRRSFVRSGPVIAQPAISAERPQSYSRAWRPRNRILRSYQAVRIRESGPVEQIDRYRLAICAHRRLTRLDRAVDLVGRPFRRVFQQQLARSVSFSRRTQMACQPVET